MQGKRDCAIGLLALGCVSCSGSPDAAAQLPASLSGAPVARVSAPASGSAVRGAVTLRADILAPGAFGVTSVRFQVDGVDVAAEDATAPYSGTWDTNTAGDGWHTLTAIVRDARGLQFVSDPVRVTAANAVPPQRTPRRFEQDDPAVSYGMGWSQRDPDWFGWSGGTAHQSILPGARATFAFSGTSVSWIGFRCGVCGIARVYVDDVPAGDVDLFAKTDETGVPVFAAAGLPDGAHTLAIEVTGQMNAGSLSPLVLIDAFEVPGLVVSRLQETDPAVSYTGAWTQSDRSKSWSGSTAATTATAGARAAVSFSGSTIRWRSYRGPDAGIALVSVDGTLVGEVDLYAPFAIVQPIAFEASGPEGDHVLTIEATGRKQAAASAATVLIDAFDITTAGRRLEETDWRVAYSGDWVQGNRNRAWSGATASESNLPGARATLTFSGTAVRWIGLRGRNTGIARVYLDGNQPVEVDTFALTEGPQSTMFSAAGLVDATHTLIIEATGTKNPDANSAWIVLDAFDVRP